MTGEVIKAMRRLPAADLVAAVDGVCAGAGAILAMASDLRLGTPTAKVAFLFNRVGLAGCDMGACAMLPRIIGQGARPSCSIPAARLMARRRNAGASSILASGHGAGAGAAIGRGSWPRAPLSPTA